MPAGYVSTTPTSKTVCLTTKTRKATVNFGNAKPATIVGLKYNDLNRNKKFDKGEPGLAGWTIRLKNAAGTTITTVTDSKGGFRFANLAPGTYIISEVLQPGYTNTSVTSLKISVTSGQVLNVTTKYGLFGNVPAALPKYAYIVNEGSNNVTVINTATNAVVTSIPVGVQPWDIAFKPDGTRAYVTNQGADFEQGTVSVIDAASNTVTATIPVHSFPTGVAVTPNGAKVYVTNQGSDNVSVINTATNAVTTTIPVGFSPFDVAVRPDGTRAYVTDADPTTLEGRLTVIDTATDSVITSIPLGTELPEGIGITPNGTLAYVASFGNLTVPGSVTIVNILTNTVVGNIAIGFFTGPKNIEVSMTSTRAYVTVNFAGTVAVIDTTTNTIIAQPAVGPNPNDVALTPDGIRAYVTIGTDGTVVTINTATNTVTGSPIPVGLQPQGIAVNPDP